MVGLEIVLFESASATGYAPDRKHGGFVRKPFSDVSSRFPENFNTRRYIYSPGNGIGANAVLKSVGLPTLFDIFEVDSRKELVFFRKEDLNFKKALLLTKGTRLKLEKIIKDNPYRATEVDNYSLRPHEAPDIASDALKIFKAEKNRWGDKKNLFNSYATDVGLFFIQEPVKVVAMIPAKSRHCIYMVYEDNSMMWYIEFLRIVEEFIDEATSLEYPIIKWSTY